MKSTFYDVKMCIVHWAIHFSLICCAIGYTDLSDYSVVYRWDQYSCDYEIYDITQYEKRLIIWDGNAFNVWCNLGFRGANSANVATSYKVCFKVIDSNIRDCNTVVEYDGGYYSSTPDKTFSCNERMPETWCADEMASLKIDTNKNNDWRNKEEHTGSNLRVEVYAEAAVNMSIGACLGMIGGIFAVIILIGAICACKYKKGKSTEGRVISTDPNSSEPNAAGQVLMGFPQNMEVMQPCGKGRYRPQNVMVQQSVQLQHAGGAKPNQVVFQGGQTAAYTPSEEQIYTARIDKGNKTNSTVKGQDMISETKETHSDRSQHEPGGKSRCSGRVSIFCSVCGTRHDDPLRQNQDDVN